MTLQPFNNVPLAAATAVQLVPPTSGRWYLTLVASEATFLKGANTVSASDAASFPLPIGVPITLVIQAPAGVWALATSAGMLGAILTPREE